MISHADRPDVAVIDGAAPTRDAFRDATERDVERVVLLSSARVYGAWADNPVPITEDRPLRPNPGCEVAARCAEAERVAQDWRAETGGRLTVLRAAPRVDGRPPPRLRGVTAPVQFLHPDDLAAAVAHVEAHDLTGVFNVAPDGWTAPETAAALVHGPLSLARPVSWERLRSTPAELAYRLHPWVVANDRLRATGWAPVHTSEEAWVVSHRGSPLERLSPQRRQELALGAIGAALLAAAVTAVGVVRGRRR